jgi:uncharacterized protein
VTVLDEAMAQASSVEVVGHRPWPLPDGGWLMGQSWHDLLFAHWRVPHDTLRPHVPEQLELEEFDGSAWVGLTPFVLSGLRLRGLPPMPYLSRCGELNCRTYVRIDDRPGIWFFSLDASSRLVVAAARVSYRLPYHYARIELEARRRFWAERAADPTVSFDAEYRPDGSQFEAAPGTLEYFLTERYCLYSDDGRARAHIHHRPWPLQRAHAEVALQALAPVALEGEPLCHFAARQDVVAWPLERL